MDKDRTPQLENLTHRQKTICEVMWAFDDAEQVERFIQTLPPEQQQEALSLRDLILLECLEPFLDHFEELAREELRVIQTCSRR